MLDEKEVINECLLVNYVAERCEGAVLVVSYTSGNATKGDMCTFYGDTATSLYSTLLKNVGICKEDFKYERK